MKGHFLGQVELCLFEPKVENEFNVPIALGAFRDKYVYLNLWWKTLCVLKGHFLGQVELCLFEPKVENEFNVLIALSAFRDKFEPTAEDGMNLERCILGQCELCLFEPTVEVCITYVCLGWSQVLSTHKPCAGLVLFISVVGLKSQTIICDPPPHFESVGT